MAKDDDLRDAGVLAGLPRSRPQRRPAARSATRPQPAQPQGNPPSPRARRPEPDPPGLVGTVVQAAGEIASVGFSVGGKAVRGAVDRLSRS